MRFWYDTEFLEDGKTIELISIGFVAEDGREYYAVNEEAPWKRIAKNDWLVRNVVSSLPRIHGDRRLLGATDLPQQQAGEHNALADARHCRDRWTYLQSVVTP